MMQSFRWAVTSAIAAFVISILLGVISGVGSFHLILRALVFAGVFFGLGFALRFLIEGYFPDLLVMDSEGDDSGDMDFDTTGQQVNITVDSMGEYAVPELYKTPGDPKELGNIEDLISGAFSSRASRSEGIDRKKEEGYNNTAGIQSAPAGDTSDFADMSMFDKTPSAAPARPADTVFTPSLGDDTGLGGLPDLDSLATAFSSSGESKPEQGPAPAPAGAAPVEEAESLSFGDDDIFGGTPDSAPPLAMDEFVPQQAEDLEQVQTRTTGNKPQPLEGDFKPEQIAQGIRTVLSKDQ
jgi:hypothetical protein